MTLSTDCEYPIRFLLLHGKSSLKTGFEAVSNPCHLARRHHLGHDPTSNQCQRYRAEMPRVSRCWQVVAHHPAVALWNLDHVIDPDLAGRSYADIVARHANNALDTMSILEDGNMEEDDVADGDAAAKAVGHIGEQPVAGDGEGGHHGGPYCGRELQDMRPKEVDSTGDLQCAYGEAQGVAEEVGHHGCTQARGTICPSRCYAVRDSVCSSRYA
jgi:hypothetical protein